MTDVIAELRSARLRSNSLERVVPHLLPIVREYEHELAEGGFTDRSGMLELATNAVAGFDRHRLVGLPALFLDVAISTEAELAFVTEFAAASPAMLATIPTADVSTLKRFRDRLGFKIENLDHAAGADNAGGAATNALARLQRHLFNEHEKPSEIEASNEIEIFSAPGEGRECVEIARRVLALARDLVPFDRIAVLLRSPEVYRSYLVEAFSRSEIPVHFARGAVRPEPAGKYVIAADGARSTVGSLADRPIVRFRVHQRTIALCRYRYRSCGGVCDTAGPLLCAKR
jgi:ATP-dependent helicase/nuclease subunit B